MQLNKLISPVCSTSWGQAIMDAIINTPKEGEPSYELYEKERSDVFNRLQEKASLVNVLFNSVEGVYCNTIMGSASSLLFLLSTESHIQNFTDYLLRFVIDVV